MIGRLSGILIEKQAPFLLVDVNGIAYEIQVSLQTFSQLPEVGRSIVLHTHFIVREDAQQLFGFSELKERAMFRTLLKVNGIGAKSALAILSSIEPEHLIRCITEQNITALQKVPGIGKKTAERLVVEIRDRLKDFSDGASLDLSPFSSSSASSPEQEAISALVSLGYKLQEASRAVAKVSKIGLNSEELIRLALKNYELA